MNQSNTQQQPAGVIIICGCGQTLDLKIPFTDGYRVKCPTCGALHLQTPKEGSRINIFINSKE